jgi:hypothetical protein
MMYHAEMDVAKQPNKRIHHEQPSYSKTEKCRLLSDATPVVAQNTALAAQRASQAAGRTTASG